MVSFTQEEFKEVEASFGRCSINKEFINVFYDIFLKSDPRIAPFFKDTNFEEQKEALKFGIANLIMYAKDTNGAYAKGKIGKLKEKHDRKHLNVDPSLYRFWINSLIESVKKCDNEFKPGLEDKWLKVINLGLKEIKEAY